MKKHSLILAAAAIMAASCNPEDKIPTVDVVMSSFGFAAENNASLHQDIFVSNPATDISIVLPYGVTDDDVKALVPTFEVTEGAVVSVEEAVIESGVTEVDFSYPVEFLVSVNSKSNAQYTVKVSVAAPSAFSLVVRGEVADAITLGPSMAFSPKDNVPYFGTVKASTVDTEKVPMLWKLEGSRLTNVCTVVDGLRAAEPTIAFSPDGDIVYAFANMTAKKTNVYLVSGSSSKLLTDVLPQTLNNSAYQNIGIASFSASDIYVGYGLNAAAGNLARRTLNLCHYNGSDWTQEVAIAGRTSTDYAYEVFSKRIGDASYMLVFNQNNQALSLYKFTQDGISTIFENLAFNQPLAETPTVGKINLLGLGFDIASDGTPYILANVENSSTTVNGYSPAVYKYDIEAQTTSIVGGVFSAIDGQAAQSVSMALDSNDNPYIAYRDGESYLLNYTYIDAKSKTWVSPITLSSESVEAVTIGFAEDGTGYIACGTKDADNNRTLTVYSTK